MVPYWCREIYFITHAFGGWSVIKFEAHFLLWEWIKERAKIKQWMNRAEIHEIFPLSFLVLSSFHSSLFRADPSRCDFVTFHHFLSCSFQLELKWEGCFKCSHKDAITNLSLAPPLPSSSLLWPAVTFKSAFSYSSQSILSIEKAPAKPDLWTNKRRGKGERWETYRRQII